MDADNAPLFHRVVLDTPTTVWARAREQYGDRLRDWGERGAWTGSTSIGEVPDVALTIFAGALLPFAHGPFLREVVGDDPLSLESGERRRMHLRLAMRAAVRSVTRAPGSAMTAGTKR
jgi:hypothetical protein